MITKIGSKALIIVFLGFIFCGCASTSKTIAVRPENMESEPERKSEYTINPGDTLNISVWKVPDLSYEVIVRPDGMISYPLIGDIKAAGLTLVQFDEDLTTALTKYVKEPQVSVMVKSFASSYNKVIVLGDVAKPGVYNFTGDIRLMEAIALAGDCTKYAVKSNILVIRGDIHKKPIVISANMLNFLNEGKLSENVLIQPLDVVFVPRSMIGNINTFLDSIAPIIDTAYKAATTEDILTGR